MSQAHRPPGTSGDPGGAPDSPTEAPPGSPVLRHQDRAAAEEVAAGQGTRRQVLIGRDEGPSFHMRRFIMEPGGGMPRHTNEVEHQQYVLRGRAAVGLGEEVHPVRPGDVLLIPARTPHWYRAEGDEPFEFLCMVPNREDQIRVLDERGG